MQWKIIIIGENHDGCEKIKQYDLIQNNFLSAIPCNDIIACAFC